MTISIDSINRFIEADRGEHSFDNFVYHLRRNGDNGVWMPGVGVAILVDEGEQVDDQNYFVFGVKPSANSSADLRYFKKTGWHYSFGDSYYDGGLIEVKKIPVQRFDWEPV